MYGSFWKCLTTVARFLWACVRNHRWSLAVGLAGTLALASGCCSGFGRAVGGDGYYRDGYGRTFTVYMATRVAWHALGAPYRMFTNRGGPEPVFDAFCTLFYIVPLADFPCEAVLDTAFLPLDAYMVHRNGAEKRKDEVE